MQILPFSSPHERKPLIASRRRWLVLLGGAMSLLPLGCLTPQAGPEEAPSPELGAKPPSQRGTRSKNDASPFVDAWTAASQMSPGINIGNTLENTTHWETGWGNPLITREYVERLAELGFKTVRVPVAWDTYAVQEKVLPEKMERVAEVIDWILSAGMFAVVNIHWDGGFIDSSQKEKFPDTFATFSRDAERKFRSYWRQIATHFAFRGERLLFEGLNEETNFSGVGPEEAAYATLTRVNQIFIDEVRSTGGRNAERLLVVTGYATDFAKTSSPLYVLPKDSVPDRLLLSVHYYTPWQFCGLEEDADWGKVMHTWGSERDVAELGALFDKMERFSREHDIPVFLGEYNVTEKRDSTARIRWLTAVTRAALERRMVPVLWDTGGEVSRRAPYAPSPELEAILPVISQARP